MCIRDRSYIIILYLIKQTIHFLHGDINELYSPAAFGKQVIYIAGHQPRRRISHNSDSFSSYLALGGESLVMIYQLFHHIGDSAMNNICLLYTSRCV